MIDWISEGVSKLKGLTMTEVFEGEIDGNDAIIFKTNDGRVFALGHRQDCCESVSLEDTAGDLQDLVGSPILEAEEVSSEPPVVERDYEPESETWTFYKIGTIKGHVNLRFYGSSNGYYSETVDLYQITR